MEKSHFAGSKTINGIELYYEYYNHPTSKETVVLIHGFLSSLFSYRHLVPLLKERFSIVSVDLPPFGKSGHSAKYQYTFKNMALTIVHLLNTLGITDYHLVGHSMGGQIVLNILHHYPTQAKKAVLLCSSGYSKRAKQSLILASYLPFFYLMIKVYLARSGIEKNLRNVVYDQRLINDEMREGYLNPFLENSIFKGLTGLLRHREGDLPPEVLHQIQTPCLLIWGEYDKVVPLQTGKRLAEDLPNSTLTVLEDTGHLVPEERPQDVYQHIKNFIFEVAEEE
ncbi:alpha/beta fold hydrolase [Mesobacillus maritimus]|uniref:alpha/beta fold hydrolase n=1 Tax=Mesobacillus maritimus TaxID=1643336 RepID=UPI00384F1DD6